MKQFCKHVLPILFCFALLLSGFCTISASAYSSATIIVGEGKTSIGPEDVFNYRNATKIVVADGVTEIRANTFEYWQMEALTLPDSLKTIENFAFRGCRKLKTVNLGQGLKRIGDCAFFECSALTEISLPESVQLINFMAFSNCNSLTTVYYNPINCKDSSKSWGFFGSLPIEKLVIGSKVERIPAYAFTFCNDLQSVTIPGNVKAIAEGAFSNCILLNTVILEEGIQTIEKDAFVDCMYLGKVVIPQSITELHENAFDSGTRIMTREEYESTLDKDTTDEKNDSNDFTPPDLNYDDGSDTIPREGYWDELWLGLVAVFGGAAIVLILVLIVSLLASLTMNVIYLVGCVKITGIYCRKKQKSSGGLTVLAVFASLLGLGFWYLLVIAILNRGEKEKTV